MTPFRMTSALFLIGALAAAAPALATSNYEYKSGEYVVVDGGLSPDQHFSIATHGDGDLGDDNFHAWLMAEPAHKPIAALSLVDQNSILDTAADAFHAVWSPDSKYVALNFRSDRYVLTMLLYEIRGRRPHELDAPLLFTKVSKLPDDSDAFEIRTDQTILTWQSATQFILKERRLIIAKSQGLATKLGAYAKPDKEAASPGATPPDKRLFLNFSAEAVCEVVPGRGYRVIGMKPGAFD